MADASAFVAADQTVAPSRRTIRRFERRAMGSPLRLTVTGASPGAALLAWGRVSDEFERAEQAMSRFRDASELSRLNRAAGTDVAVDVDRRLRRALVAARRAQRISDGRFDPRVLADLERLGYRGATVTIAMDRGERPGDLAWLTLDGRMPGVAVAAPIDLGGIGKGLALRWAWRRLQAGLATLEGTGALLEAGGDIVAGGPSPNGGPWLVGIDDPRPAADRGGIDPPGGESAVAVVAVDRGAVCTSSIAVHRWRDSAGRPVHHLVDPATGEPGGEGLLSVTVAGPDPAWAEVWSKTLFLEGGARIAAAARRRGLAAWWVTESGDLQMTPAARPRTAWAPSDR